MSDIRDFLDDAGEPVDSPAPLRRMAEFLGAIIDAVTRKYPTVGHNTKVRCCRRGSILASLQVADGNIAWRCTICRQSGMISNWQGTKWDHTTTAVSERLPSYTPWQGLYLAFIRQFTKIHGHAPMEHDIAFHFELLPPAVHDTLRKLKQRGYISWEPGKPRSIRLLLKPEELADLE